MLFGFTVYRRRYEFTFAPELEIQTKMQHLSCNEYEKLKGIYPKQVLPKKFLSLCHIYLVIST